MKKKKLLLRIRIRFCSCCDWNDKPGRIFCCPNDDKNFRKAKKKFFGRKKKCLNGIYVTIMEQFYANNIRNYAEMSKINYTKISTFFLFLIVQTDVITAPTPH